MPDRDGRADDKCRRPVAPERRTTTRCSPRPTPSAKRLWGAGSTSLLRLRSPSPRSSCASGLVVEDVSGRRHDRGRVVASGSRSPATTASGIAAEVAAGRSLGRVRRCSFLPLPGVLGYLGTRHSAPAVGEPRDAEARGDALGDLAPGAELYPFDPRWCSHSPSYAMLWTHRLPSRIKGRARAFNQRVSPWWSELHRVAKLRADRATGFKGTIAARVWEKQKRGLARHAWRLVRVDAGRAGVG